MIQAVNSTNYKAQQANNNSQKSVSRPNFGQGQRSKAGAVAANVGTQFVMGAVVSSVFSLLGNAWNKMFKSGPIQGAKPILKQAAFIGVCFAAISLIFDGFAAMRSRNSR